MQPPIIIIGGGLAGLACAAQLIRHNQPVVLFEATERLGGRIHTEIVDGYRIDRGFQLVPESYPALTEVIELQEIGPYRFDSRIMIWDGTTRHRFVNPLQHPKAWGGSLRSGIVSLSDTLRLARLVVHCRMADWTTAAAASVTREGNQSVSSLFEKQGFSQQFITRFSKPFASAISLDPTLSTSAGPVLFALKMLGTGAAILPADGLQALPDAIAIRHPDQLVRLGSTVDNIVIDDGRAVGVMVAGETIAASAVVVATDTQSARILTGIDSIPNDWVGCTTVYLGGSRDPGIGKSILLDGSGSAAVDHIAPLANVAPSYAPPGKYLVAAVLLETPHLRDRNPDSLNQLARAEVARMLGQGIEDWHVIATVRTPYAQLRQPPGFVAHSPRNRTNVLGLYLAGDFTVDTSINGLIQSGVNSASAVMRDRGILTA